MATNSGGHLTRGTRAERGTSQPPQNLGARPREGKGWGCEGSAGRGRERPAAAEKALATLALDVRFGPRDPGQYLIWLATYHLIISVRPGVS